MLAKGKHRLTTRTVATIKKPGFHADGGGLYLQVTPSGSRSWVYRFVTRVMLAGHACKS